MLLLYMKGGGWSIRHVREALRIYYFIGMRPVLKEKLILKIITPCFIELCLNGNRSDAIVLIVEY